MLSGLKSANRASTSRSCGHFRRNHRDLPHRTNAPFAGHAAQGTHWGPSACSSAGLGWLCLPLRARETVLVSSCSDGNVSWRADYAMQKTSLGPLVKVNALTRIVGRRKDECRLDDLGVAAGRLRVSRSGQRGDRLQAAPRGEVAGARVAVDLPLAPDGCAGRAPVTSTCHRSPTATEQASWPRVAVLGDSLLSSLNDLYYNTDTRRASSRACSTPTTCWPRSRDRAAAVGPPRDPAALDAADSYLLDEFRGLVATTRWTVSCVALGANDAAITGRSPRRPLSSSRRPDPGPQPAHGGADGDGCVDDCVVAVTAVAHPVTLLGCPQRCRVPEGGRRHQQHRARPRAQRSPRWAADSTTSPPRRRPTSSGSPSTVVQQRQPPPQRHGQARVHRHHVACGERVWPLTTRLAERVGFEPTDELPRHLLSRKARSTRLRHLSRSSEHRGRRRSSRSGHWLTALGAHDGPSGAPGAGPRRQTPWT